MPEPSPGVGIVVYSGKWLGSGPDMCLDCALIHDKMDRTPGRSPDLCFGAQGWRCDVFFFNSPCAVIHVKTRQGNESCGGGLHTPYKDPGNPLYQERVNQQLMHVPVCGYRCE